LLREATDQFIEAEIPVLGAVINGVEGLATPLMSAPIHPEAEFVDRESEVEKEVGVKV
jgi:hypothetical protein